MNTQGKRETYQAWQARSHTREGTLRTALHNGGGDMNFLATSMIYKALWPLYESGKLSDLTVTCQGRRFQVHKAIVCSQSPFFDKACTSGFKEGIEHTIDLPEDDPDIVNNFFQFLYAGNYSDGEHFHGLPSKEAMMSVGVVSERLQETLGPDQYINPEASITTPRQDGADNGGSIHGSVEETDEGVVEDDGDDDYETEDETEDEDNEEGDGEYTPDDQGADMGEQEIDQEPLEYHSEASDYTNPDELYDSHLLDKLPPWIGNYQMEYPVTSILVSLRVYVMADKYDVPALKLLAKERFVRTVENFWLTYAYFPAVVDELFASTMPNDPLQIFVCELVVCQYHVDPDVRARMKPVMERHPGFAVGVLEKMVALTHM